MLRASLLLLLGSSTAHAEVWSAEASLAAHSAYQLRGQTVTPEPVLQPALNVVVGVTGGYFGIWSNLALNDRERWGSWDETDLYAGLGGAFGESDIWWDAMLFGYIYPTRNFDSSTGEFIGTVGLDHLVAPELASAVDVRTGGVYGAASLRPSLPLVGEDRLVLHTGWTAGISNYAGSVGLQELTAEVGLGSQLGPVEGAILGVVSHAPAALEPEPALMSVGLQLTSPL